MIKQRMTAVLSTLYTLMMHYSLSPDVFDVFENVGLAQKRNDLLEMCIVDAVSPPAYRLVFRGNDVVCIQRPWKRSSYIVIDDCECAQ